MAAPVKMAQDGAQIQDKWQNTDLNVRLYWPEFLALPLCVLVLPL